MRRALVWALVGMAAVAVGCGSQGQQQQKADPIRVAISPAQPSVRLGEKQQFTATVANTQNQAVTWAVNEQAGGNATAGTIDATGLYTAPQSLPNPAAVAVSATSAADNTKTASTTVTLLPAVTVAVTPATITLVVGGKQAFQAVVTGTTNTAVNWSVNGQAGGNATVGTIDGSGNYTAPSSLPSPPQVTVTATSQADGNASGTAQVTLQAAQTDLEISPATATLTLNKADSVSQAFQVTTPTGFQGTVTMSVSGLPPNVAASWDQSQLTGNGTATLTLTSASFSLGAQGIPLVVTATSKDSRGAESDKTAAVSLSITGWQGHMHTLAGVPGGIGFEDGTGTADEMDPVALAADAADGVVYTVSHHGHALRKVDLASQTVTTLVGGPYSFSIPFGVALAWDAANSTLYLADVALNAVEAYPLNGTVQFVAKDFNQPQGLAISPDDGTLYVADSGNQVIEAINLASGAVTTVAGTRGHAGELDGMGTAATMAWPWGIAVDPSGKFLYFDERYSQHIRRVDLSSGQVTTLAGTGQTGFQDGPAAATTFTLLGGMAVDPHDGGQDLLYFTDKDKVRALTLGPSPVVVTIAGQEPGGYRDSSGDESLFDEPSDVKPIGDLAAPGSTSVFVADSATDAGNGLLRRVDVANPAAVAAHTAAPAVTVTTVAGQPPHAGLVDGAGTGPPDYSATSTALFNLPQGITTDGKVAYVGDSGNDAIRKIDLTSGEVTTVAGGHEGYLDGPAAQAAFFHIGGVQLDAKNNLLYIADTGQGMVRELDLSSMMVSTVAGSPQPGYAEGVGTAARFNHPWGLALSPDAKTLYVTDVGNNAIRTIDLATGTVATIAGGQGPGDGDGVGPAAHFFDPTGLALSPDGKTLYISDFNNSLIRKLDLTTMTVVTIAGKGPNYCGHQDGVGTAATLCSPALLATDGRSLYWGDSLAGLLRVMNLSTGQVTTVAGAPGVLHMQDGDLTEVKDGLRGPVQFNEPFGLALAPDDSFLLITDQHANVVRILN